MMLNSYASIENRFNYNINAVSGTLRKSHPKSKMATISLKSSLLDIENPSYMARGYQQIPVVVLQVMLCGDNTAVAEFILKSEFEDTDLKGGDSK